MKLSNPWLTSEQTSQSNSAGRVSEMMYARYERTSYHAGDIGHFRNALREILSPILDDISNRQHQLLSLDSIQAWDEVTFSSQGNHFQWRQRTGFGTEPKRFFKGEQPLRLLFQSAELDIQLGPDAHSSLKGCGRLTGEHLQITMNTEGTMRDVTALSDLMVEMLAQKRVANSTPYGVQINPDRAYILKKSHGGALPPPHRVLVSEDADQYRFTYLLREISHLERAIDDGPL